MNSITQTTNKTTSNASAAIQERVNVIELARHLIGSGIPTGASVTFYAPQIDPDHPEIHVFERYYRNPVTGTRGGAIKLVQICKSYSYVAAVAFLEGFEAATHLYLLTNSEKGI